MYAPDPGSPELRVIFTPDVLPDIPCKIPDSPERCTSSTSILVVDVKSSSFFFSRPKAVRTTSSSSVPDSKDTLIVSSLPTVISCEV